MFRQTRPIRWRMCRYKMEREKKKKKKRRDIEGTEKRNVSESGQRDEGKAEREEMGEGLYLVGWDCGVLEVHSQGPRQKKKKTEDEKKEEKGKARRNHKGRNQETKK